MRIALKSLTVVLLLSALPGIALGAELIVSAAASLTNAFTEIGKAFERAHPGHSVIMNFGSSGQLFQQIERGAPVHVFASADQETMNRAQAAKAIDPATRVDFTRNALVVIAPAGSALQLAGLQELQAASVRRIAVSNPDSVPVGRYTREVLEAQKLWAPLAPKIINTQHVRQSLDYVARGEVDAGFVYSTDAAIMPDKVSVLLEVATPTPITYPIATVPGNGNEALAAKFVRFVLGDGAQQILQSYGFRRLP